MCVKGGRVGVCVCGGGGGGGGGGGRGDTDISDNVHLSYERIPHVCTQPTYTSEISLRIAWNGSSRTITLSVEWALWISGSNPPRPCI